MAVDFDDDIFATIFDASEGSIPLNWEQGSRCSCTSGDTKQPSWECPSCGGTGVLYAAAQAITGLFRAQSRWLSFRRQGEFEHGEAQLTTPLSVRPGYVDRRVRDRLTVTIAVGDVAAGHVFYPAAQAVPFIFNGVQRAWRVQLQSTELSQQLEP